MAIQRSWNIFLFLVSVPCPGIHSTSGASINSTSGVSIFSISLIYGLGLIVIVCDPLVKSNVCDPVVKSIVAPPVGGEGSSLSVMVMLA